MELNLNRPLIVFDLETTGVNVGSDRIVEISMVKVLPDGQTEIYTERINPTIPIPAETTAIHGISDEDVKDKPTFAQLAPTLLNFIGNADLSGYNAIKFDIPLLVEEFLRAEVDFEIKGRKLVDVQNIFHKMEPRNLSAAYKFYCKKEMENAHSAEADAVATFEILKSQLDMYENVSVKDKNGDLVTPVKNDINALSEFSFHSKNADLVGHIIFNDKEEEVFNFGKHKGRSVSKTFEKEPQYYDWMMKSQFPLSTKKVITSIYLRGFNKSSVNLK
ncbi:MAG: 3'-5' exonuclease [Bacteroidales bacterium]|nr:3'-5' exonuclease [Bacteroidales bacterium]MCF8403974.1 3'-5' exonuclease [Bacteroidales bacterium]